MDDVKKSFALAYGVRKRGKFQKIQEEPMVEEELPMLEEEPMIEEPPAIEDRASMVKRIVGKHFQGIKNDD